MIHCEWMQTLNPCRDVVKELGNWIMCYKFGFTTDLIVVHITKTNCHNFKKEFRNLIIADKADLQLEGTSMIWLWIPAALAFNDENHSGCFLLDRLRSCLCSVFWLPSSICGSKEKWWLFMQRNLIHFFFLVGRFGRFTNLTFWNRIWSSLELHRSSKLK